MSWKPSWWKDEVHGNAWERVKEAARRDWEQTKKDLHLGGHEYNQGVKDTVMQAAGRQEVPPGDGPNPPHVIGNWNDVELPYGYGHWARSEYGQRFSSWHGDLEALLQQEWERELGDRPPWDRVRHWVRSGYERPGGTLS